MRRFFARRGIPNIIYTDNGTQLVAIKKRFINYIEDLKRINSHFEARVTWQLQTPSSPWRGGFYERLIRSVKHALTVITFNRVVNYDELTTIFCEIEQRINSRPLFKYDDQIISPSHFFAYKPLTVLPSIGNNEARQLTREGIVDTYIKSQRMLNALTRAWRDQYLLQLRQYHQNIYLPNSEKQFKLNDIVIIKSSTPSDTWPLGMITKLLPSPDGKIRSYEVTTLRQSPPETKIRALQTLIPLECENENI